MKCGKNFFVKETAITVNGAIKNIFIIIVRVFIVTGITYFLTKINVQKVSTVTPLCPVRKNKACEQALHLKRMLQFRRVKLSLLTQV